MSLCEECAGRDEICHSCGGYGQDLESPSGGVRPPSEVTGHGEDPKPVNGRFQQDSGDKLKAALGIGVLLLLVAGAGLFARLVFELWLWGWRLLS